MAHQQRPVLKGGLKALCEGNLWEKDRMQPWSLALVLLLSVKKVEGQIQKPEITPAFQISMAS